MSAQEVDIKICGTSEGSTNQRVGPVDLWFLLQIPKAQLESAKERFYGDETL